MNIDGYHSPHHNGDSTARNITHSTSALMLNNQGSGGLNKSSSNFTISDET
jgi:hypothetical protein